MNYTFDNDKFISMNKIQKYADAIVLGMHDALVSQTGIIAGLAFALADRRLIILTGTISAVAAGLSMAASNYLAEQSRQSRRAIQAGLFTGSAYLITSGLLMLPFVMTPNVRAAMASAFVIAILIIFLFNCCIRQTTENLWRKFLKMLLLCVAVSVVAFLIGEFARMWLGIDV